MTIIPLADYLGRHVDELLRVEPFSGWRVVRSVETDPKPEVWYEFEGRGVEVICDELDRIQTLFLHRGEGESLAGVPFSTKRQEVLERFGTPASSGGPVRIPVLGDRGAWDRFTVPEGSLHVQYSSDRDEIDMITLIRPDAVP
jgi:hypothetical protein